MTLPKSSELAKLTFNDYLLDPDSDSSEICLMINNLGGISNLELSVYTNDCVKYLLENKPNLKIARIYCGTFMTSLSEKSLAYFLRKKFNKIIIKIRHEWVQYYITLY